MDQVVRHNQPPTTGLISWVDFEDSRLAERYGMGAKAHIDLGMVKAGADGKPSQSVDEFLRAHQMSPASFSGRCLELVAGETIGLQYVVHSPGRVSRPLRDPLTGFFVLISNPNIPAATPAELDELQSPPR